MPRPDSKIMQTAVNSGGTDTTATAPVTDVTPKATRAPKAAKVVAPPPTKAELKQKKLDLAAALKLAREPLDKVDAEIAAINKADVAAEKAAAKAASEAAKIAAKAVAARQKEVAATAKTLGALAAKQVKYLAAYEKTKAKIDAQIAAL